MQMDLLQSPSERPQLSTYTDFRAYLKDFFEYKKQTQSSPLRAYSYATFSAAANIKSPNYLKLIIEGQRNLSETLIQKFAVALQLDREETKEFEALVQYGQAKDPLERNRKLKILADLRVQKQIKSGELASEIMDKVPSWVSWVLYALTDQKNVHFDVPELRALMRGRANREEIKKALEKLFESGELVKEDSSGRVKKGRALMQGAQDVPPALVRKLQAELIYLGMESLFQDEPQDREFGAFTMALTKEEFEHLKFEIRQMRKRLYKDFSVKRESSQGDRVYQLNFQLFPVTEVSPN